MKFTKRMNCQNACAAVIAVGIAVLSIGCQTTVPISYTEPARINMPGVKTIGIISNNSEATATISAALTKTGKYTVVTDEKEVNEERRKLVEQKQRQEQLNTAQEVSAEALVKAYTDNAARADSQYNILKVSGTVTEMKENFVRLGVASNSVDVYTMPSENAKIINLNKGDTVTVLGECQGFKRPDLADTAEILRILGAGQHVNVVNAFFLPLETYKSSLDAMLTLETNATTNEETRQENMPAKTADGKILTDAKGNKVYKKVNTYRRIATVTINYDIARTSDSSSIGHGQESGRSQTDYYESKEELNNASMRIIPTAMEVPLKKIVSDMVPTERTLSLKLAKSDSTDKEFKSAMSEAQKLVKEKKYDAAADAYGKLYAQNKDFAAGYNQAVLTEVAHGTEEAVVLMEAIVKSSGNPDAQSMLSEMHHRNAANKQSAEQLKK